MTRPLLALACAFGLGAWLGEALGGTDAERLLVLAAATLVPSLAARPRWAGISLLGAALALGAAGAGVEADAYRNCGLSRVLDVVGDVPVHVEGLARRDAIPAGGSLELWLSVERIAWRGRMLPAPGNLRVRVGGNAPFPTISEGDRVALWARLRPPHTPHNPAGRDRAEEARRRRIHAEGYCKSSWLLAVTARGAGGRLARVAGAARAWARRRIEQALPPGREREIVRALVLGERAGLPQDTVEAFRSAGTYHVLALSGAHVAMLAAALGVVLSACGVFGRPRAVALVACLAGYAWLVGGDVPIVRAALMASAWVLGRAVDLEADSANLLGLAALALLAQRPPAIGEVGFELSFAATLGIVLVAPALRPALGRLPRALAQLFAASLAAQIALAPLLVAHFHRLAPAGVVLNLLAVPLAGAVLLSGLGIAVAGGIPGLGTLVAAAAFAASRGLLWSGDVARGWGWADPRLPSPAVWAVAFSLAGAGALALGRGRRGVVLTAVGVAGLVAGRVPDPADGCLHVTMLDVGQGQAIAVRTPLGNVHVVDAGPAGFGGWDAGEEVVAPLLWQWGERRIRTLVLTHRHRDHAGGAAYLLRGFAVDGAWLGPVGPSGEEPGLAWGPTRRTTVFRGVAADWDGVGVEVLGPGPRAVGGAPNDGSLLLRLTFGGVRFVLAGDVEAEGERGSSPGPATVLSVPHHGSRTSSSPGFVAQTRPGLALVSVAARNPFGHPASEVLERYRKVGALVLRTDRDGAISVSTDGTRLWVRTQSGWTGRLPIR